jgi:hypothetical protein
MEDQVSSIVALIQPLVKALKMPKSVIDEMANDIAECTP